MGLGKFSGEIELIAEAQAVADLLDGGGLSHQVLLGNGHQPIVDILPDGLSQILPKLLLQEGLGDKQGGGDLLNGQGGVQVGVDIRQRRLGMGGVGAKLGGAGTGDGQGVAEDLVQQKLKIHDRAKIVPLVKGKGTLRPTHAVGKDETGVHAPKDVGAVGVGQRQMDVQLFQLPRTGAGKAQACGDDVQIPVGQGNGLPTVGDLPLARQGNIQTGKGGAQILMIPFGVQKSITDLPYLQLDPVFRI